MFHSKSESRQIIIITMEGNVFKFHLDQLNTAKEKLQKHMCPQTEDTDTDSIII